LPLPPSKYFASFVGGAEIKVSERLHLFSSFYTLKLFYSRAFLVVTGGSF
jgi:hypothetical protein